MSSKLSRTVLKEIVKECIVEIFEESFFNNSSSMLSENKEKNTKQQVFEWVSNDRPEIVWPTKILKSGPNKGQERLVSGVYDMADAYVIGKSHYILC